MSTSNGHATGKPVSWTKPKMKQFRAAIKHAEGSREIQFEFDGNEYDLKYAKYLLEYLEDHFK
jgi:hypothetical protein